MNKKTLFGQSKLCSKFLKVTWGCSSVGRAPALHAGGQEFESLHLHQAHNRGVKDFKEIFHNFSKFSKKTRKITKSYGKFFKNIKPKKNLSYFFEICEANKKNKVRLQ